MPRILDPNSPIDPAFADAVAGRNRTTTRAGAIRSTPRKRKDKFYVPPELIPKGYVVQWKRKTYFNKPEDPDYFMDLDEAGWKAAPLEQFRKLMPEDYQGKTVERGGCILMMRPKHMDNESRKLDREEAASQVRDKLMEVGGTGQGELGRKVFNYDHGYDGPKRAARMVPDDDGDTDEGEE